MLKSFDEVIDFAKNTKKLSVITRGEKGAVAVKDNEIKECKANKNLKIRDLTGQEIYLQEVFCTVM